MTTSPSGSPDASAVAALVPVPPERDMPTDRQHVIQEHLLSEFRESEVRAKSSRHIPRIIKRRMAHLSRRAVKAGVLATATVTAAIVVLITVLSSRSMTAPPVQAACSGAFRNGNVPFPSGYETTVAHAQSAVGFPIPVPHTPLADRHTLAQVWASRDARLVALVYDKGTIKILLQPWPVARSPESWFSYERRIMAKHSTAIGRVNGEPALITQPRSDSCRSNPASVDFYRRGIEVYVSSTGYGTAALLGIAQSMR